MARKSKTESETEYLKGRNKELEKENKSLRRRLKQLEKHQHNYEPLEDYENERNEDGLYEIKKENWCGVCGKSELKVLDLGIRKYSICPLCGAKEKIE